MSYWHIVEALYAMSGIAIALCCAVCDVFRDDGTNGNGWQAAVTILLTAYMLHNIEPDIARIFHSVAMCHG